MLFFFSFFCMVFLHCMEPEVIQQQDQQLYVTSEPRREWTSITRNTHLWPLNGMAENRTCATEMASKRQTDHAIDGLGTGMRSWRYLYGHMVGVGRGRSIGKFFLDHQCKKRKKEKKRFPLLRNIGFLSYTLASWKKVNKNRESW